MFRRIRKRTLAAALASASLATLTPARAIDCNQNGVEDADDIALTFSYLPTTYSVGALPFSMIAADLSGDNHPDLVTANKGAGTVSVLVNDSHGVFLLP